MLTAIFTVQRIEICKSINLSQTETRLIGENVHYIGTRNPFDHGKLGTNHICAKRKARQRSMSRLDPRADTLGKNIAFRLLL